MTTTVVNIRDLGYAHNRRVSATMADLGLRYVYIGRPSKWGNPFKVGKVSEPGVKFSRGKAVEAYRVWLLAQDSAGFVTAAIEHELKDKILVCWCKPLACHGDVLAELADS